MQGSATHQYLTQRIGSQLLHLWALYVDPLLTQTRGNTRFKDLVAIIKSNQRAYFLPVLPVAGIFPDKTPETARQQEILLLCSRASPASPQEAWSGPSTPRGAKAPRAHRVRRHSLSMTCYDVQGHPRVRALLTGPGPATCPRIYHLSLPGLLFLSWHLLSPTPWLGNPSY